MWKLKTSVIPIVAGALGLVKKGAAKHLEKISGKQNLAEIQNIVLTITSHILRKALSIWATTKKWAQNKNLKIKNKNKKNTEARKKYPFRLPQVSARDPTAGL